MSTWTSPSRRTMMASTAAALAAGAVAACGSKGSGDGSDPGEPAKADFSERGPITLAKGKDTTGHLRSQVEAWNKEHPDEEVTFLELSESADEQRVQLVNNARSKSDAYTVLGMDVVWMAEFAANKWVVELPKDRFPFDDMVPSTVTTATYFDRLYGVPWASNAELLFYRKDLLEKAGADSAPTSVEEMFEIAEAITGKEESVFGFGSQFAKYEGLTVQITGLIASAGGVLFDDEGTPHADSPEAIRAMTELRSAFDSGVIPKEALTYKEEESRQAFQDGRLVFMQNWPYIWELVNKTDGSSKVTGKVGLVPLPGIGGKKGASTLGGLNWSISAFAGNHGTAADFISYLVKEESQKEFAMATAQAPTLTSLYEDKDLINRYAFWTALKEGIDAGVSRPPTVRYAEVTQAIQESAYRIISGEAEVEPEMKALQKALVKLAP
ncbi:ABC transporter substrate-binding protein [Helcobacillus sp. ACRRO]|uniref:ABC transporter substrate-binding protein n=1 Tax=Helcobacillus TaxID=1161125 RepID=UPI001EF4A512|nr:MULTISPECIES: ABC transporter substrate-binding protein [Helcobacillus]MCG7426110.1 ABC transporter substrate-binding protein [Helcobacillus sp. ACRRO]MDK7741460.1 ABC transporter substrate-binding protein [Helcobacillus massiliensis]WOO92418.1 ABC transporter substrate-binding protein [Helcobacillus massiliensis]